MPDTWKDFEMQQQKIYIQRYSDKNIVCWNWQCDKGHVQIRKRIVTWCLEQSFGFGNFDELVVQVALVLDPELACHVHDLGDDLGQEFRRTNVMDSVAKS